MATQRKIKAQQKLPKKPIFFFFGEVVKVEGRRSKIEEVVSLVKNSENKIKNREP